MLNLFGVGADEEMKSTITNEEPKLHKGDNITLDNITLDKITLLSHGTPQASPDEKGNRAKIDLDKNENTETKLPDVRIGDATTDIAIMKDSDLSIDVKPLGKILYKENRAKFDLDKNENTETKLPDVRIGEATTDVAIMKDADLSIDVKPLGKIPYYFRDHLDDNAWKVYMLLFVYINTIIIALVYSGRYSYHPTVQSPWISKANATNVLIKETKAMENEYQKVMLSNDWKILRSVPNITIEIIEKDNEAMYIRIIAIHHLRPSALYEYFSWNNFDSTMKMVDPFYESSKLLFSPSTHFYTPSSAIQIAKKVRINLN
jgi:soluble P-type ATPase